MSTTTTPQVGPGVLLKVSAAADYLAVSRAKLYLMMDAGELPYCKFGKSRRILREDLDSYIQNCRIGG